MKRTGNAQPRRQRAGLQRYAVLGLALLAFVLRAYRLDAQSYWIDEGWTLHYAGLTPDQLWHVLQTTKIVPPLYHFMTLYWSWLVGNGEYAMRFCSLVFGVMSVPLTYRLGKALGDARLGVVAALLMAMAPYQIWHSQDARNYTMLTAASIASMWGFVGMWKRGGRRFAVLYVLGTEWALMTHYHAVVVIGIQGIFVLATLLDRHRPPWRRYVRWGAALAIALAVFGVWLIFGFGLLKSYLNWIPQPALWDTYARSAVAYSVGELVPLPQALLLASPFLALYLLGLVVAARRRWGTWDGRKMLTLMAAYTLAPNLAAWVYGALRTPVYLERYLIPVQVGYFLVIGIGLLALVDRAHRFAAQMRHHIMGRGVAWAAMLPALLLVGISAWVLGHHYCDPAYAKPDWRTVAHTIEDYEVPGDAIVITGDGSDMVFKYYYRGSLPVYLDFNTPAPPPDRAAQRLAEIAAQHRRIWYTPYGVDVDTTLESWLAANAHPAWQSWVTRQRLALYATDAAGGLVPKPVDSLFTDGQGREMSLTALAAPGEGVPAGDVVPLTLTWAAAAQIDKDYGVSMRLINHQGDRFAQADWPPLAASGTTSTWQPGRQVTDRRGLWLPADVPPGAYELEAALYEAGTGRSLGAPQTVAQIEVDAAGITVPRRSLTIPNPTWRSMGDLTLVGYALPESLRPGQDLQLWLYWQATPETGRSSVEDRPVRVIVAGTSNTSPPQEVTSPLSASAGTLEGWRAGQVRRTVHHLATSPRLTAGQVVVSVTLGADDSGSGVTVELPPIMLQQRQRYFDPPHVAQTSDVAFGDPPAIKLIGYDVPTRRASAGNDLLVTLYWQALAEANVDYTVFLQMLSGDWRVIVQQDLQPQGGSAPTSTWVAGEFLADPYRLHLPDELPAAEYRIIAGLYDAQTGQRLPVSAGGDFTDLGTVQVP